MADPSSFTIRELTGDKRTLVLAGRALPYQPLTYEGKMRAEFTHYSGLPVATIQMLGAMEGPSTFNGMWKDRFLKSVTDAGALNDPEAVALFNGVQVEDARALVDALDSIRLAGQLLEVTWDTIIRHGVLTAFRLTWARREDVEWSAEFTWSSRGETPSPVAIPATPAVDDLAARARTLFEQISDAARSTFQVSDFFASTIGGLLVRIDEAITVIEDGANGAAALILTPVEAGTRVLAAVQTIKDASVEVIATIESTPASAVRTVADVGELTFGQVLEAESFTWGLKESARDLRTLAAEEGDRLRHSTQQADVQASFTAREDMDLRQVSTLYFGNPDEWRRLAAYNGLQSSRLAAGQLVLIPRSTNSISA